MSSQRIVKPRTQKARRALEKRAPKVNELTRVCLFVKGSKTSERGSSVLQDLHRLKRPNCMLLGWRHEIRPFENAVPLETFSQKYDASLCAFLSHSKKRPHNLTLMSMFDHQVLDMVELGIVDYKSLSSFKVPKVFEGCKPCLLFIGELFEHNPLYQRLKTLLLCFFYGEEIKSVALKGLEHVICFTAVEGKVFMRSYRIVLKKSGVRTPRVELVDMGPHIDWQVGRSRLAESDLLKQACKRPKVNKPKKVKNVSYDAFGTKMARVHMQTQDFGKLQTRKMKALKRPAVTEDDNESSSKRRVPDT